MSDRHGDSSEPKTRTKPHATMALVAVSLAWAMVVVACSPGAGMTTGPDRSSPGGTSAAAAPLVSRNVGAVVPPVVEAALASWVCSESNVRWDERPTLFVAPDGSDASDGRSIERPLRTLQAAANRLVPGDVVWLRSGVYPEPVTFTRSGTPDAPIVVASAPGECAILDGDDVAARDRSPRTAQVTFDAVQHVVFHDVVVRRSPAEGILLVDASHVTLEGLHLHHNHFSGVTNVRGARNLFRRVVSHDNVDVGAGGDADGISLSSGEGHRVERVIAFANADDGIDTWRSTGSLVERCLAFGNGRLDGDGNGVKAGGAGERVGTVVRRCVAFGNRSNGFDDNTGRGVRFDHDTAFANGMAGFASGGATLRNNLSLLNEGGDRLGGARGEEITNSWELGVGPSALASLSPSSPEFLKLREGGSATDVGTPIDDEDVMGDVDLGALAHGETLASLLGVDPGEMPGADGSTP